MAATQTPPKEKEKDKVENTAKVINMENVRKGRKGVPSDEKKPANYDALTKEQQKAINETIRSKRFIRMAVPRVRRAIKLLNQIGNLAGPNYLYTETQVTQMEESLTKALDKCFAAFSKTEKVQEDSFTLS